MNTFKRKFNPLPINKNERKKIKDTISNVRRKLDVLNLIPKEERKNLVFMGDHKHSFCTEIIDITQQYPYLISSNTSPEQLQDEINEYDEWVSLLRAIEDVHNRLKVAIMLKGVGIHKECSQIYKYIEFIQYKGELESIYQRLFTKYFKIYGVRKKSKDK